MVIFLLTPLSLNKGAVHDRYFQSYGITGNQGRQQCTARIEEYDSALLPSSAKTEYWHIL